jgi:hypothetical protein
MVIKAQRFSGDKRRGRSIVPSYIVHSAVNSTHLLVFL